MINKYINSVNERREKKEYKELCFFGYGFGIFICVLFLSKYLFNNNNLDYDKYYKIGILFGAFILLMVVINPYSLIGIKKVISSLIYGIFNGIFIILLTILYYLCISPIGWIMRYKSKKNNEITSNFVEKTDEIDSSLKISKNKIYQVFQIISMFFKKEYMILLPSIIIMVIFGILFVFLQSNIVAPFIYTLF